MPPNSSNSYRQLPGSGGSAFQRHRLWIGADHVLSVASSAIGERYRRFYFADLQALVWRPTAAWVVRAILWLLIAALCALGLGSDDLAIRATFGSLAALFVVVLIIDLAMGKTCACFVKTAVQFERLPSLSRVRTVRKVLAQLHPLVEQAQRGHRTATAPVG